MERYRQITKALRQLTADSESNKLIMAFIAARLWLFGVKRNAGISHNE